MRAQGMAQHVEVTCYGQPNFRSARIPVLTKLNLQKWAELCVTPEDPLTFQFLQFGFPVGYEDPTPPGVSLNGCTPRESFLGNPKKMHLPSATDFCDLIRRAGKGCFLFATDVARAYHQLPLDPRDWPRVCFTFECRFVVNISLPYGLRWAASPLSGCHQSGVQATGQAGKHSDLPVVINISMTVYR